MEDEAAPTGMDPALSVTFDEPDPKSKATAVFGWPRSAVSRITLGRMSVPVQPTNAF